MAAAVKEALKAFRALAGRCAAIGGRRRHGNPGELRPAGRDRAFLADDDARRLHAVAAGASPRLPSSGAARRADCKRSSRCQRRPST